MSGFCNEVFFPTVNDYCYPFLFLKASDEEGEELMTDEHEGRVISTTHSHEIQGQVGYDSIMMDATQPATQVSANFYFLMRSAAQSG